MQIVPYLPPNEFGQEGWLDTVKDTNVITKFSVISKACKKDALETAMNANDPVVTFKTKIQVCMCVFVCVCVCFGDCRECQRPCCYL
jgi:hypothetical protein